MNRQLTIGIASLCAKPGDLTGNLAQLTWAATQAAQVGCDLLLTPEMSATGYGGWPDIVALGEPAGAGPIYRHLATLARTTGVVMTAGFVEQAGECRFLGHYVVFPDGQHVVQRKNRVTPREHPLDAAVPLFFDDSEDIGHVQAADAYWQFFVVNGVRCGIVICADLGVKALDAYFQQQQVALMLLPTGAGGTRLDRFSVTELASTDGLTRYYDSMMGACFPGDGINACVRYGRALAAVNMCGYDGRHWYHGGQGSIIDRYGDVQAVLPGIQLIERQRPRFVHAQIDFDDH